MSVSEEQIRDALKSVKYPGFTRDIVSFGLVKSVNIDDGQVKWSGNRDLRQEIPKL